MTNQMGNSNSNNNNNNNNNNNTNLNNMSEAWGCSEKNSANMAYLESLYEDYLENPSSIDPTWKQYFDQMLASDISSQEVPNSKVKQAFIDLVGYNISPNISTNISTNINSAGSNQNLHLVKELINSYRCFGHRQAKIDPIGLNKLEPTPELLLEFNGLSEADLENDFSLTSLTSDGLHYASKTKLKHIITDLQNIYCQNVGIEYMYITNPDERKWLKNKLEVEQATLTKLSDNKKKELLKQLTAVDTLEKYLAARYVGQKRFSLEGCDSLIPLLDTIITDASKHKVEELTMCMAHRGRLNVLINILGKAPESLFEEFEGIQNLDLLEFLQGDVKYHKGYSSNIQAIDVDSPEQNANNPIHLAMAFNPSHLEIVSSVLEGSTRARQDKRKKHNNLSHTENTNSVMSVHMHGDSAISGQGVVMELLNMSQIKGYSTGGALHIVVNNQIGFTTSKPEDTRSTVYCTDIAKMVEAPVFHVNANDPEAVIKVAKLAVEYRTLFHKDIFIDLVGYRRLGHNEADEPAATQPMMYAIIKKMKTARELYTNQLIDEGVISKEDAKTMIKQYKQALEHGEPVINLVPNDDPRLVDLFNKYQSDWKQYKQQSWKQEHKTNMPISKLTQLAAKLDVMPKDFTMQKQVNKTYADRKKMTAGELALNWGYAELLAYATLLEEGFNIRISGEDCQRGTFAHRHAVVHDFTNGNTYMPLAHISKEQGDIEIINSLLSEEAVVGYEYGYACANPNTLVIWEAQFGDFANGAQVIFDQFLSSGEEKWGRLANLCLFLPHGNEGMGAEHSSARLERFLQLCANDNMQVCVPSTPAQAYHMIRRQMIRKYRKPLVVMTPKSLLRNPMAVSNLKDLADQSFQCVIDEIGPKINKKKVSRVILCCGKIYYELLAKRQEENIQDIALIRIEQLYPFPYEQLTDVLQQYNPKEVIWCQEEPKNQGAYIMIRDHLQECLAKGLHISLISRPRYAAPASGYPILYKKHQITVIKTALKLIK